MNASQNLPWPGWEIVRRLGGGSYGKVYEIRREQYHIVERAALKVISFPSDPEEVEERCRSGCEAETLAASYRRQMERVLEEYSLMMQLKRNPNVVLCDTYETVPHADGIGWDIYIRMELLTPLKKYLGRVITPEQTIRLGEELCNALIACREKDIIHRDIKPDNILMTETGAAKLGDFGIAKMAEKTMAGTRTGTPGFIAPEVFHNRPYGKSVDIYSLGMVLYWMLNRRTLPFLPLPPEVYTPEDEQRALQRRMQGEALPRPADGSRALQDVVLRACAYDPADRYATPEEFRRALEAVRAADTSTADTIPDVQPVTEQRPVDVDATMGNNWEAGPQTETQTDPTDFDVTDATMGTCGTLPDTHAQPQPSSTAAPVAGKTDEFYDYDAERWTDASDPDSAEISYDEVNKYVCLNGIVSHSALRRARQCMRAHSSNHLHIVTTGALSREIMIHIGSFTDLDSLVISSHGDGAWIENLSPLTRLQTLTYLNLVNLHLTDISPLADMAQLQTLRLSQNEIVDLAPLSELKRLTSLEIGEKQVSDFTPLFNLPNLTDFHLRDYCYVTDYSFLSNLTNLKSLYFNYVGRPLDLATLPNLTNLTSLFVGAYNVELTDLTPLSRLEDLTELSLFYCYGFADFAPLSRLTKLTTLKLYHCPAVGVSDFTPLSSLANLINLSLVSCRNISSLTLLSGLTSLTSLDISECKEVSDLSPLSGLTNLKSLDLHDCKKVSDLLPLSTLKNLESLDIRGTDVKSLNGLENARNLQRLNASRRFLFNTRALKISGRKAALQITP